jgi:hypothetical protein
MLELPALVVLAAAVAAVLRLQFVLAAALVAVLSAQARGLLLVT